MSKKTPYIRPAIKARARELRRPQTPAEAKLWACLRDRQAGGFKFRRQHPIDRFIVDFYCHDCRLVIEIDGDTHAEQMEYDQARTDWLNAQGYHVIRFSNREVVRHLEGVVEVILGECQRLSPTLTPTLSQRERELEPSPSGRGQGEGEPSPSGRGQGEGEPSPSGRGQGEGAG